MLNPADTFQTAHGCKLVFHQWDTECVVYNIASGDTHLINAHAALILQQIAETPASFAALKSLLINHSGDSRPDLDSCLEDTLNEFIAIDLIERVEGDRSC